MADDVDPDQPLTPDGEAMDHPSTGGGETAGRGVGSVDIAMLEIELVEFESIAPDEMAVVAEVEPLDEPDVVEPPVPEIDALEAPEELVVVEELTAEEIFVPDEFEEPLAEEVVASDEAEEIAAEEGAIEESPADDVVAPDEPEGGDALPTMADLDRVASELDDIDARLASLDEQRP